MRENLRQATEDPSNQYYAYVTRDDLVDAFGDDVVLTIRNYDICDATSVGDDDDGGLPRTLRVYGRFKTIDVRLVTDDGEALKKTVPAAKEEAANPDELYAIPNYLLKTGASNQSLRSNLKRRPGRPRRNTESNLDLDSHELSNDSDEEDDRRESARVLLGYKPSIKRMKRNFDDDSDSFESRYYSTVGSNILVQNR